MAETGGTIQAIATYLGVKCGKITYDGPERVTLKTSTCVLFKIYVVLILIYYIYNDKG